MAIGLVKYERRTTDGMSYWALPDGCTSSIDLRRLTQITDPAATGYAIAIYPGDLPADSVALDTGNATRDRDAWKTTLGYRPEGDTPHDQAWSMLLDGSDDTHADTCRPLRCGKPDRFEMWLGERQVRRTSQIDRLKQGVYVRRDLDAILDDVQAGKLPGGIHRKVLKAESNRLGIDWRQLRSKSARWRGEDAVEPTTTITDTFKSGAFVTIAVYGWAVGGENGSRFQTGDASDGLGSKLVYDGGGLGIGVSNLSTCVWHPTSLSLSNNLTTLSGVTVTDVVSPFSAIARGNGTTSGYLGDSWTGSSRCAKIVAGTFTQLATVTSTAGTLTLRVSASGSTIKTSDSSSTWQHTVTDTSLTTGLRVGVHGYSAGGFRQATGFDAEDILPSSARVTGSSTRRRI